MNKKNKYIVSILIIVVAGVFFQLMNKQENNQHQKIVHPPIRIALNDFPGFAYIYIAEKKDIFKKNGVQVEIIQKPATEYYELYKNKQLDGIFVIYNNVIDMFVNGVDSKVVYVLDYSNTGDGIIGKSEFTSLADLEGSVVSFDGFNNASHVYVLKALSAVGLNESNTSFEVVAVNNVLTAIKDGKIDAGYAWEPELSKGVAKGYKLLSTAGDIPGSITDVLAFHGQIVKERPDEIQAIVKSLEEALVFLKSNRDEAISIMSEASGISIEEMANGISGVIHPGVDGNSIAMSRSSSSSSLYGSGDYFLQFLLSRGQVITIPNLEQLIDPSFVHRLKKE
ncbi:MAG: ABC transporter substrate-binding protein [Magnetococcales bacterium]|nr:ABC transporter substrate-binding protein [Magnetococcales bacterium]